MEGEEGSELDSNGLMMILNDSSRSAAAAAAAAAAASAAAAAAKHQHTRSIAAMTGAQFKIRPNIGTGSL